MADVRCGKVDIVAVWRFDRFARSTTHLLSASEEFRTLGVEFLSLREQVDSSTAMGKAIFTIVAAISELERELIRERVVAGVRRAQRAGKHCGRPRRDVPVEAAVALLREGRSLRDVSKLVRVDRNTLRTRLREQGLWPLSPTKLNDADRAGHQNGGDRDEHWRDDAGRSSTLGRTCPPDP